MANDEALKEKEQGNAAYKSKNFSKAIEHYKKVFHSFYHNNKLILNCPFQLQAIELDPSEITFYSNLAAVHFEKKEYDECVKVCEKAIDVGRENRADFKLIAKAWNRAGNGYRKLGDLTAAKNAFEKALTEHRTPEYKSNLSEVMHLFFVSLSG